MKKLNLPFCLLLLFLSENLHPQSAFSYGLQVGFASNFNDRSKLGFGFSAEEVRHFADHFAVRASSGYTYFKSNNPSHSYVSFLPAQVGLQGHITHATFVLGEAGISFFGFPKEKAIGFSYSLGAGFKVPLNTLEKPRFIQFSASYNFFRQSKSLDYTWLNVRAAYGLSWNNKSKL